jgi:hypothetical protein
MTIGTLEIGAFTPVDRGSEFGIEGFEVSLFVIVVGEGDVKEIGPRLKISEGESRKQSGNDELGGFHCG